MNNGFEKKGPAFCRVRLEPGDIVAIVSNLSNTNVQENLVGILVNEGCVIGTK